MKHKSAEEIVADLLEPYLSSHPDVEKAISRHQTRERLAQEEAPKFLERLLAAGFTVARMEEIKGLSYPLRVYRKIVGDI